MKKITLGLLALWGLSACSPEVLQVNVYSHRHYDADKQLFAQFTKETGIQVKVVEAKADELIQRIKAEGAATPADLLITVDAGRLEQAKAEGILQKVSSPYLERQIPAHLRHPEGYWFSLTKRARVIFYNKDLVNPQDLKTYEDLGAPKFQGKVIMRSSSNMYNQSLVASLLAVKGEPEVEGFLKALVNNFAMAPQGGDTDNIKAVALGKGAVTWANTYYYGKLLTSANPEEVKLASQVGVLFPAQEGRGTHINVSGAGIIQGAPHRAQALKLLEYLASEKAQRVFAEANFEYPVIAGVAVHPALANLGSFKEDQLPLQRLGELNRQAVQVMDRAQWK